MPRTPHLEAGKHVEFRLEQALRDGRGELRLRACEHAVDLAALRARLGRQTPLSAAILRFNLTVVNSPTWCSSCRLTLQTLRRSADGAPYDQRSELGDDWRRLIDALAELEDRQASLQALVKILSWIVHADLMREETAAASKPAE